VCRKLIELCFAGNERNTRCGIFPDGKFSVFSAGRPQSPLFVLLGEHDNIFILLELCRVAVQFSHAVHLAPGNEDRHRTGPRITLESLINLQGDRGDRNDRGDVKKEIPRVLLITTSQVTGTAKQVAQEQESDMDADAVTARRVGRVLRKMRWPPERTKTARGWAVNLAELQRLSQAYGVDWPAEPCAMQEAPPPTNVTSVISVTSVTAPGAEGAGRTDSGLSSGEFEFEEGEI